MTGFQPYDPDAQNDDNGFNPPADGKHKAVTLTDARAFTSENGNDGVLLKFKTTDGYEWAVWQGFKSEGQSAVTWTQVGRLGVDQMAVQSLEELDVALKPHIGAYYDVTVKTSTSGQFRNTNVDGLSAGANPAVQQQAGEALGQQQPTTVGGGNAVPADDIPFAPSVL